MAIRFRRPRALRTPCVFLGRPIDERMRVILKKGIASSEEGERGGEFAERRVVGLDDWSG